MNQPFRPRAAVQVIGLGAASVLAMGAIAAAPAHASASAGASASASAASPVSRSAFSAKTLKVGSDQSLRTAVRKANKREGTTRIKLTRNIKLRKPGGDLDVKGDVILLGSARFLDARGVDRHFDVKPGASLDLRAVALVNGAPAATQSGGAVRNAGRLIVSFSLFKGNAVSGAGASGGAIFNNGGTINMVASRVNANRATRAGGAIEALGGRTNVADSLFRRNSTGAEPGNGGAIHLTGAGTVRILRSTITSNFASSEGGGLWNSAEGTFEVVDSVVNKNVASGNDPDNGGGGIFNDGGDLTVRDTKVSQNRATGAAGSGGGVFSAGGLELQSSTFIGNSAQRAGGGLEVIEGSSSRIEEVTFMGNEVGAAPGNGGGVHLTGTAQVTYTNGEVSGNSAASEGGGLWNSSTGLLTVAGVTIADNTAPTSPNNHNDGGVFTVDGIPVAPAPAMRR